MQEKKDRVEAIQNNKQEEKRDFPPAILSDVIEYLTVSDALGLRVLSSKVRKLIDSIYHARPIKLDEFIAKTVPETSGSFLVLSLSEAKLTPSDISKLESLAKEYFNIKYLNLSAIEPSPDDSDLSGASKREFWLLNNELRNVLPKFKNLEHLIFRHSSLNLFAAIKKLEKLKYLDISGSKLNGISAIKRLPLTHLIMNDCQDFKAESAPYEFLSLGFLTGLKHLEIKNMVFSNRAAALDFLNGLRGDAGLMEINGLRELTHLNTSGSNLEMQSILRVAANNPKLTHLDMGDLEVGHRSEPHDNLNNALVNLSRVCTKLEWLDLRVKPPIKIDRRFRELIESEPSLDEGIKAIADKNPDLFYLNLYRHQVSETALKEIRQKLPNANIITPDGKEYPRLGKRFVGLLEAGSAVGATSSVSR